MSFPWRTLLFISLALNLLVIGAVAGLWGAGVRLQREQDTRAVVERLPGPRAFLAALAPETRAKMADELAESWTQSRELRRAAAQARRDAFVAASAEPYDIERVRAAYARLRAADQAAIAVFHDHVVEAFGQLTPEERHEALEALRNAAPAARRNVGLAPGGPEQAGDAAAPGVNVDRETLREQRREKWRERRRQRQEQANP
jgi:uncharacterized membrane protein